MGREDTEGDAGSEGNSSRQTSRHHKQDAMATAGKSPRAGQTWICVTGKHWTWNLHCLEQGNEICPETIGSLQRAHDRGSTEARASHEPRTEFVVDGAAIVLSGAEESGSRTEGRKFENEIQRK